MLYQFQRKLQLNHSFNIAYVHNTLSRFYDVSFEVALTMPSRKTFTAASVVGISNMIEPL